MLLSYHLVSSFATISLDAQYNGHSKIVWGAVSSIVPHSQIDVGANPHLCLDGWYFPTPMQNQLSCSQAGSGQTHSNWPGIGLWGKEVQL